MKKNNRCRNCLYEGQCYSLSQKEINQCEYLSPLDEDTYCDDLIEDLKRSIVPAGVSYLPAGRRDARLHNDGKATLYEYYRQMINDALSDVRSGKVAYLYKEDQLRDFLRYERDVEVWLRDGVFYISRSGSV